MFRRNILSIENRSESWKLAPEERFLTERSIRLDGFPPNVPIGTWLFPKNLKKTNTCHCKGMKRCTTSCLLFGYANVFEALIFEGWM